jgi:streptogramin lyase
MHRVRSVLLRLLLIVLSPTVFSAPGPNATLTYWQLPIPPGEDPRSNRKVLYAEQCDCVYYSALSLGRIGRLDLKTNRLIEWTIPTEEFSGPFFLTLDTEGRVYYSQRDRWIGRLDPATGVYTHWRLPFEADDREALKLAEIPVSLYELAFDASGKLWAMGNSNHKVYRLDPETNVITTYAIPHNEPYSTNLRVDQEGQIWWLGSRDSNSIDVLDPKTNLYTEWSIPTWVRVTTEPSKTSFPHGLNVVSRKQIFFVENDGNKIGRLNADTNRITEWTVTTQADHSRPCVRRNDGAGIEDAAIAPGEGQLHFIEAEADAIGRFDPSTETTVEWSLPPADLPDAPCGTRVRPLGITSNPRGETFFVTYYDAKIGRLTVD